MRPILLTALLGALLMLTGCPLQTAEPVDEGSYTETGWLLDRWTELKADGSAGAMYRIRKGNEPGHIRVYTLNAGKEDTSFQSAVLSNIGNHIFLSVFTEGGDGEDKGFYIFQLLKQGDKEFDLMPVKEYSLSSDAPAAEIRAWLANNAAGDIYEKKDIAHYRKSK